MKRFFSLLLSLVLLISLAVPASASQLLPGLKKSGTTQTAAFTDPDSGAVLTVPTGWKVQEVKNDLVSKAKFTYPGNSTALIEYGSMDVWEGLDSASQKKTAREDLDNSLYTCADVASMVNTDAKYVKLVKLDNVEYFQAEIRTSLVSVSQIYLIRVSQGWMYVYVFSGSSSSKLYPAFEALVTSAQYPSIKTEAVKTDADTYKEAIEAYNQGSYTLAALKFLSISDYQDSAKYLRLLNIRNYGSNTNFGTGYSAAKGLTKEQMAEIDAAAEDFFFADTAEVLLCNTDVACYYLLGDWETSPGEPYADFRIKKSGSAWGYSYKRSTSLSNKLPDTAAFDYGDMRIYIPTTNTLLFHIDLISPDCMYIYSYETCKTFMLNRQ